MSKKDVLINRLKNSIRDLSNLKQSGQLTANQCEVLRICLVDMKCLLRFLLSETSLSVSERELEKLAQRLSLWLLNSQNLIEQ